MLPKNPMPVPAFLWERYKQDIVALTAATGFYLKISYGCMAGTKISLFYTDFRKRWFIWYSLIKCTFAALIFVI